MRWTVTACIVAGCACFLSMMIYMFAEYLGVTTRAIGHAPGPCRVIPGIDCGSESIALTSGGLAFISSGLRFFPTCNGFDVRGEMYLLDLNEPDGKITKLNILSDSIDLKKFEPLGIDVYENNSEAGVYVFIVDVSEDFDVVRVFYFSFNNSDSLQHMSDIRDPSFQCINSIAAINSKQFYVTNSARFCKRSFLLQIIGDSIMQYFRRNGVAFYDGSEGRLVTRGHLLPNGVAISPDLKWLYVADTFGKTVFVYKRDLDTNSLNFSRTICTSSHPDNVFVHHESGSLLIGAHPSVIKFFTGNYNGPRAAPSQVIKIHPTSDDWSSYDISEMLFDSGMTFLRGVSSAALYKGRLLLGTVYHKLAICNVT